MDKIKLDKALKNARERIKSRVAEGFDDEDQISVDVLESVLDEGEFDENFLRERIEAMTAAAIGHHHDEQETWPERTDCDRLDDAFDALEAENIAARQNFSCCSNCGHGEIWGDIEEETPGRKADGYVFYHMQNTGGAAATGRLFLSYGAYSGEDADILVIGRRIVTALERQGLKTTWSGSSNQCVEVDLVWRRRR
jgi:hypothetical protein